MKHMLAVVLCVAVPLLMASMVWAQDQPQPKKLFIEERIAHARLGTQEHCYSNSGYTNCYGGGGGTRTVDVSANLTKGFVKQCPGVVSITGDQFQADYTLHIARGASTLYNAKDDVVYISPAAHKLSNVAKDICGYVRSTREIK